MKKLLIPLICLSLSALSLVSLNSIAPHLVGRQALFVVLGLGVFYLASRQRFKWWQQLSPVLFGTVNLLLLLLLFLGATTRGIRAWIPLFFGLKLQPSQFTLTASLLFVGLILPKLKLKHWPGVLSALAVSLIPAVLIIVEPDLGTGLVYLAGMGASLLLLPIDFRKWLSLGLIGLVATVGFWQFGLKSYQRQRLSSFIQPSSYSSSQELDNAKYNARQALITVGSGKIYGRGLGAGVQSHLKFLPERQTDFIFASFAEEWGFIGSSLVVLLYAVLVIFMLSVSLSLESKAEQVYVFGLTMMLFAQIMINIGMNLGLVPITGITLPLLSYGGSSIIAIYLSLSVVQGILIHQAPRASLEIG